MTEADSKQRLGSLLVEAGLLTTDQVERVLANQKKQGGHFGYCAVSAGYVTTASLAAFFEQHPNAGRIQEEANDRQKAAQAIPRSLALYYKIAPIKLENKTLTIAISEINHPHLMEMLSEITGFHLDPLICPESEIRSLVESGYRLPSDLGLEFSAFDDNAFVVADPKKLIKALSGAQLKKDSHIGERLRSIIAEAIKEKCREIIIKPQSDRTLVFFKKDSLKQSEFVFNAAQQDDLAFFLFRLCKMNPLQSKKSQNGRFQVKVNDRKIAMTVSSSPTMYGMRFRLEMFDEKILKNAFEELVHPFPELTQALEDFLKSSRKGIFAITGPEGSGRTLFLYSMMIRCKGIYKNIQTLELSIRYPIAGVTQNEVAEDQIETILQDLTNHPPDLLALTSLRTIRQAELAFLLAAQIPVIAILPAFDAFRAIDWLCSHNLKSAVKAGLLHTVVSPRIVPQICPYCSVPLEFDAQNIIGLKKPEGAQLKMNQGCDHCRGHEGMPGQIFFETLRINDEAVQWILSDHSAAGLRRQARASGRNTLYDLVVKDAFQRRLDMLSVAKLQAAL